MLADTVLAILHHVLVFMLLAMLVAEFVLVRPGLGAETLKRLAGIDGAYGGIAVAVFAVGVARLIWGATGWEYYAANPWFWAKIVAFVLVGLASAPPTLRYGSWRRAAAATPGYLVPDRDIARTRGLIHAQLGLFILIPVFAALMARY